MTLKVNGLGLYLIACDAASEVNQLVDMIDSNSFKSLELDTRKNGLYCGS